MRNVRYCDPSRTMKSFNRHIFDSLSILEIPLSCCTIELVIGEDHSFLFTVVRAEVMPSSKSESI